MDALSDLDVELYVDHPSRFLDDGSWYEQFGEVLVVEELENPGWHPTRLVYYVGGKIDFMIAPVDALPTATFSHPFQILVDNEGLAANLRTVPPTDHAPPDPTNFDRCNHWFYAALIMCAKAIARNEPWQAKMRDWDAKQSLLKMIEWDHKIRHGWSYATEHVGSASCSGWKPIFERDSTSAGRLSHSTTQRRHYGRHSTSSTHSASERPKHSGSRRLTPRPSVPRSRQFSTAEAWPGLVAASRAPRLGVVDLVDTMSP
jgi:hypothetical protein